jgi:chromosome segregation ATPase
MLFGKKNKEPKSIPIEEVKKMAAKGMADKEIIKDLKHKGYGYNEIEKAMLNAVKEGVDNEKPATQTDTELFTPQADIFEPTQQQTDFELPTFEEEATGGEQTDVIIEELVEGIIEEKWQKFEQRITKIEESIEQINAQLRSYDMKFAAPAPQPAESESRLGELTERLDDLDARVGGLEKAFKQFLPSLTRNIEALSGMIHEIKQKARLEETI